MNVHLYIKESQSLTLLVSNVVKFKMRMQAYYLLIRFVFRSGLNDLGVMQPHRRQRRLNPPQYISFLVSTNNQPHGFSAFGRIFFIVVYLIFNEFHLLVYSCALQCTRQYHVDLTRYKDISAFHVTSLRRLSTFFLQCTL